MRSRLDDVKQAVWAAIDEARPAILGLAEEVWRHPELGYKEEVTAARVKAYLEGLGLSVRDRIALTGLRTDVAGAGEQAKVGLMCELDAVVNYDHPAADPETGAVHACGHHMQIGAAVGALTGLVAAEVMPNLDGGVSLLVVPAEEPIDLEYRANLVRRGLIRFLGGKQEFLRLGEFDDLDAVLMIHADSAPPAGRKVSLTRSSNGFLTKRVRFAGREAHAGAFPWDGINALNACLLGLMGIHAQRETFREEDVVRVHPIITRGGDAVNVVPADVRLETYVRAASVRAMSDANAKVSRALKAGGFSVGAQVEIENLPGFLPLEANPRLNELFGANAVRLAGEDSAAGGGVEAVLGLDGAPRTETHMAGSTDMGDVSQYRPAIQPMIGGVAGKVHTRGFAVVDPEAAFILPAKALAATVIDLLADGAGEARKIRAAFTPRFDREGYRKLWDELCREGE